MVPTLFLTLANVVARAARGCCCAARAAPMQTSPRMPRSSRPTQWPHARAPACAPARLSLLRVRCARHGMQSWRLRSDGGWRQSCEGVIGASFIGCAISCVA